MEEGEYWSFEHHIGSQLAEAFAAEYLHQLVPGAIWYGRHKKAIDMAGGTYAVDAKVGFYRPVRLGNGAPELALGFMGTSRTVEVREGVSHYCVVVAGAADIRITRAPDPNALQISGFATADIYFIPAADANAYANVAYRADGEVGKGLNRWMPIEEAKKHQVRLDENR